MTSSERRLEAVVLRIRVALAIGLLAFVGIAQQTALMGGELLVRGLAVGLGLGAAAGMQQLAGRRHRETGAIVGIVAEFFAFAIAVALFERYVPLAPVILIWPIVAAAFFVRQIHVLSLAALATAMVLEIGILRNGAQVLDLITATGWGALYVSLGSVAAAVATTLRRSQRQAASAYASVATVSTATTYTELAEIVFGYIERVLDLPGDAPAAFLFDPGDGMLAVVASAALEPEARARFRLDAAGATRLEALAPAAGWIDPLALDASAAVPAALRDGAIFLAPLRDDARLVGFLLAGRDRRRRISPETAAALERLTAQAAIAAIRIRGARAVEGQREAMGILLDGRGTGSSDGEIAAWLARTVRELVPTDGIAVLQDAADATVRVLLTVGLATEDVDREALVLVNEGRRRGVAVIIPDAASEQRLALPPFLRRGACVLVPLRGHRTYLLVQRHARDSFTTGDLQLLVLLCDQAAALLTRADTPAEPPPMVRPPVEVRLAAVTAHVPDVAGETHAQEDRARIVDAFRLAIEGNQPQLAGSGERVAAVTGAIAAHLRLPNEDADAIYVASLLRDVGELGIDRRILDSPGHLSPEQREVVERHPLLGETILATLAFLSPVAQIVRAHHERWDGTGYPGRLRGEDIPLGARIVAVADAYVAMTSQRPYRAALRASEAMGAVVQGRGRAFDPAVVDALVSLGENGSLPLG